jgi:diamine N-acetyltransferase
MTPTTGPRATTSTSRNAPARKVDSRVRAPDRTLIIVWPIIAQPPMPPKNPVTTFATPLPSRERRVGTVGPVRHPAGMELRLATVTPDNVAAACRLTIRPEQEGVVAPVAFSLAEAYASPDVAWPRLVLGADDEVLGFVMAAFDPDNEIEAFRCGIWRLNVAADAQGLGVGRFAVQAVSEEARRRGNDRITVLWERHPHGPEGFYLRLGFRPTGEELFGEVVGELVLPPGNSPGPAAADG